MVKYNRMLYKRTEELLLKTLKEQRVFNKPVISGISGSPYCFEYWVKEKNKEYAEGERKFIIDFNDYDRLEKAKRLRILFTNKEQNSYLWKGRLVELTESEILLEDI